MAPLHDLDQAQETLLRISQVSEETGLSPSRIRFYEHHFGFYLQPQRTAGGHRRYSRDAIRKLLYIKYLVDKKNLSLSQVRARLTKDVNPHDLVAEIQHLKLAIRQLHDDLSLMRSALEYINRKLLALEDRDGPVTKRAGLFNRR